MTIEGTLPQREPPRLHELWDKIKTRLATPTMNNILKGAGRIYVPGEFVPPQEGPETEPWSRLVVSPIVTPWGTPEELGRHKFSQFLVRVDHFRPQTARTRPNLWLEAAHAEAFRQLHGWLPANDMQYAYMEFPLHREIAPQPSGIWDPETGLFYMSSVYNMYVSPVPLEEGV